MFGTWKCFSEGVSEIWKYLCKGVSAFCMFLCLIGEAATWKLWATRSWEFLTWTCKLPLWSLIVLMMAFPTLAFLQPTSDGNSLQQCEKLAAQLQITLRACNARFGTPTRV